VSSYVANLGVLTIACNASLNLDSWMWQMILHWNAASSSCEMPRTKRNGTERSVTFVTFRLDDKLNRVDTRWANNNETSHRDHLQTWHERVKRSLGEFRFAYFRLFPPISDIDIIEWFNSAYFCLRFSKLSRTRRSVPVYSTPCTARGGYSPSKPYFLNVEWHEQRTRGRKLVTCQTSKRNGSSFLSLSLSLSLFNAISTIPVLSVETKIRLDMIWLSKKKR